MKSRAFPVLPCVMLSLLATSSPCLAQAVDSAAAVLGLEEFNEACRRDGGSLWGRTLCGAVILVDPGSRFAVATERPPAEGFEQRGTVYVGRLPDSIPLANTSITWGGAPWATLRLPLPDDRFARIALMAHESFHRIQPALGLTGPDAMNPQLDDRDGRYWLRLELRALAAALRATGDAARDAAKDAVLFRARRHQRYPGTDTLESQLEQQEGLAEYTGDRLAVLVTGAPPARVAENLAAFESRPSFVRSFGYATGPGMGLLLDRYAPGWRDRIGRQDMATQLAQAVKFSVPADLAGAAAARAGHYDAVALAAQEDARDRERQLRLADYRARLVDGPVLVLRQERLSRSFNPNTLEALPPEGTVYPTGAFGGEWGELDVTGGGALVATDYRMLRVPAPSDTSGTTIHGDGWTLKLAPGWMLRPGSRAGDLTAGH